MPLNRHFQKPEQDAPAEGIFCDVYGTLVSSSFTPNMHLVEYLNAQYEAGVPVTIFSSDHFGMRKKTRDIGLHPDLAGVVYNKAHFANILLETLIDDDPPHYLKAQKHWNPKSDEFRIFLKAELERLSQKPPAPPPPAP